MPADVDRQRQLCRDAYAESVVHTYQRLATADSEYVRLNALKQLARIVGIVQLLTQLHDLSVNARSEWIALRANDIIADYLQLFSDNAADNRPEPLTLDLAEQLAVQQQFEAARDAPPAIDPNDPNNLPYFQSAVSDPPQPTQQLPADAAPQTPSDDQLTASDAPADQPCASDAPADQPATDAGEDQPTDQPAADATDAQPTAGDDIDAPNADQPTDAEAHAEQPDDHTDQPEPLAPNLDQPEAIERLFKQAEELADRLASQLDPDPDLDLNLDPPT